MLHQRELEWKMNWFRTGLSTRQRVRIELRALLETGPSPRARPRRPRRRQPISDARLGHPQFGECRRDAWSGQVGYGTVLLLFVEYVIDYCFVIPIKALPTAGL